MNGEEINAATMKLRAVDHPFRMEILSLLTKSRKLNVSKLVRITRRDQPFVSHHLKILKDANLVGTNRRGKYIFYRAKFKEIKKISNFITELSS